MTTALKEFENHPLIGLLKERIVILDGAMGTNVQTYRLTEADYRGERFVTHSVDLKGNNDLLSITKPEVIEAIHEAYLLAGADIIETNTFNSTSLSQSDYQLESLAYELNRAAVKCAKNAVAKAQSQLPKNQTSKKFIAGAIGPLSKTLSISRDVNDPGARDVTFDQVKEAYTEQIRGLLDEGVDLLLVETIFDTLNAKAALFAIQEHFDKYPDQKIPIMVSGTITDLSGRTLIGQTVEAFYTSVAHAPIISIGLNCALGPKEMRPYIEELSHIAPVYVSCYPNAGLPDPLSPTGFPETPETLAPQLKEWADCGWLNFIGGCCGTTPPHILAIAEAVKDCHPRVPKPLPPKLRLSGLEALIA